MQALFPKPIKTKHWGEQVLHWTQKGVRKGVGTKGDFGQHQQNVCGGNNSPSQIK